MKRILFLLLTLLLVANPAGAAAPTVTTQDATGTFFTTTTANGNVTATGDSPVTIRGFAYKINDPTQVSLLHFDGTNNSTTFTDDVGNIWTPHGDSKLSTTNQKFGTASGYFDGTGDYISTPNSTSFQFGSGNFTIEYWIKADDWARTYNFVFSNRGTSTNVCGLLLGHDGNGRIIVFANTSGSTWNIFTGITFSGNVSAGSWHHIALVRNGSTWTGYVDGVAGTSQTSSATLSDNGSVLAIGGDIDGTFRIKGYVDELRITKGVARWTANFTPPTAPYSTSPTTADSVVNQTSSGFSTGAYSLPITGLTANTTYLISAYATNSTGTSYGSPVQTITDNGAARTYNGTALYEFYGASTWTPPTNGTMNMLIVGGGGGGGGGPATSRCGAGGAGGLLYLANQIVTAGTPISVTVGAGGSGGVSGGGGSGTNSSYGTNIAYGGGGGAPPVLNNGSIGLSGGSGGGGGGGTGGGGWGAGGSGTAGQGHDGGAGHGNGYDTYAVGGGGGGAGGVGTSAVSDIPSAAGGAGLTYWGTTYAKGGSSAIASPSPAADHTGNGGDSPSTNITGMAGGSGIVVIQYMPQTFLPQINFLN